ncbi:MAG: serine hydroxymethyltransferase [Thermoplasmataceae archaeon]
MSDILEYVKKHDEYRKKVLNLQASENILSPDVRSALSSDLNSRYSLIDEETGENAYGGTVYSEKILEATTKLAEDVFRSKFAEVRPMGGHIAAMVALISITKRKGNIMAIAEKYGGYTGYSQGFLPDILSLHSYEIPYDGENQSVDLDKLEKSMKHVQPAAILLGQSFFLRPYDLRNIRNIADSFGCRIVYDASHVLGLVAGGSFQHDALQYSDILFGSTHKSFFGPQGSIMLTNNREIYESIEKNLTWRAIDNYHLARVAGLGVALEEMSRYGKQYAQKVVKNSHDLGEKLFSRSIPVMHSPWFSESHQLHVDKGELEKKGMSAATFSKKLEKNGIIVDREGRIGTAEMTRMGIDDTDLVASLIKDAADGKDIRDQVKVLIEHREIQYWR